MKRFIAALLALAADRQDGGTPARATTGDGRPWLPFTQWGCD